MISEKKYYSIREVSKMLNIKEHVIRHWDSIDPKTNKLRIQNLSMRTAGGTRFFNKFHIKKISNLMSILQENGKRNHSLDLAVKIISKKNKKIDNSSISDDKNHNILENNLNKIKKITNIKNKLKSLIY